MGFIGCRHTFGVMWYFRFQAHKSACDKGRNSKNAKGREKGEHGHTVFLQIITNYMSDHI